MESIPALIDILLRERTKSLKKIAGVAYGDDLAKVNTILKSLTSVKRSLQQYFSTLTEERDSATASVVRKTKLEVETIRATQHQQHEVVTQKLLCVSRDSTRVEEKLESLREDVSEKLDSLEIYSIEVREMRPLLNSLYQFLSGLQRDRNLSQGQ